MSDLFIDGETKHKTNVNFRQHLQTFCSGSSELTMSKYVLLLIAVICSATGIPIKDY